MRRRRLKLFGKILLGIIVLLAAFLLVERFRGQIALARFKRELAAKGETLDVQKLIVLHVADVNNGAPEILALKSLVKKGKVIPENYPPKMELLFSGRAIVGFREKVWGDEKVTNSWKEAALDLTANQPVLDQLGTALAKPTFDFKLDHSRGFEMDLTHLAPIKSYCQWLGAASQNSLHRGENQIAFEYLLAAVGIPKVLENNHILISELVRVAISSINFGSTWEALQRDVWTEEQLARLQAAWERNTFATNMVLSLRVERADGDTYYERFRKSNDETYKYMFPTWLQGLIGNEDAEATHWWQSEFIRKQIYCRVWRFAWLHQDEKFYLQGLQRLIEDNSTGAEMAARPGEEYWFGLGKAPRQNFYDDWRFGMSAQSLGSLSRATLKSTRGETARSLVICAIALKRYSLRHDKPPEGLAVLVPEFLSAVPMDYMDGKPVKYRLNTDGNCLLYSVGEDGKDDGGDMTLLEGTKTRDLWKRRDYVWPAPATLEEVEEYRQNAGKN